MQDSKGGVCFSYGGVQEDRRGAGGGVQEGRQGAGGKRIETPLNNDLEQKRNTCAS